MISPWKDEAPVRYQPLEAMRLRVKHCELVRAFSHIALLIEHHAPAKTEDAITICATTVPKRRLWHARALRNNS